MEITSMYDVVIVGGGASGLSAALIFGRARRRVLVLDAGSPRNAPAEHSHGFLSRDGTPPDELLHLSREQIAAYPSVAFRADEAVGVTASDDRFAVTLRSSEVIETRKLLFASGVVDVLPDIPGLRELWGRGVVHCPYCHGWEVRDTAWGILGEGHLEDRVALFRGWASELVVLANGASSLPAEERHRLQRLGVQLEERRIAHLEPSAEGVSVTFEGGSTRHLGAIFVAPAQAQRSPLPEALGCELVEPGPFDARYVAVDGVTGETTVTGIYAAGDMTGPGQSIILASASGARAAYALNRALGLEDVAQELEMAAAN
jgi:thioredoxin reductase